MKLQLCLLFLSMTYVSCVKNDQFLSDRVASSKIQDVAVAQAALSSTLYFSGHTWTVKDGTGLGPGPNNWAAANAFVDSSGYLHLKINRQNRKWYCAEVTSTENFGYGTYQWFVEGPIDLLDKNVVLGLFNYSGVDGYDEMDIEYAKWGVNGNMNTNFTVYPAQGAGPANWHTTYNTTLSGGTYTTQRFTRNSNASVFFQELGGFHDDNTNQLTAATCNNPPNSISTVAMPVHMNLWLYRGYAPSNKTGVEIIIHSFKFTPQL